ncbi:alkaline phosphatase family protein [Salinibacterium sp. SWN248]|uniref:alkaline phosphatase family protein n=1 Tax=Salinibacterium sp. SWN248 TaxID=2792056 RepID=UPI0018CCC601|nr:nucleotide pyrophosphatase/phosphodiesterase family protein [Salinibacterium sp. SWN248]MBH0024048.1 alkaline phosphatase family protein [Salinibacterium sp. SWN248]
MLPALNPDSANLTDVLSSSFQAIAGEENRLSLPPVRHAVVLLVDGLGAHNLKARVGHARTLAGAFSKSAVIQSGFPTTTAAAIASLTTGQRAGQHGLVGYSVLDAGNDRVINQLSGWDSRIDPATWQRVPTLFERATERGFTAVAVGAARYRASGFTHAVLRGARYVAAGSLAERLRVAVAVGHASAEPSLTYVYAPELDMAGHANGWQSPQWTHALESLDSALASAVRELTFDQGLLVTADHGMIDVPHESHVLFDTAPELLDGVAYVAGEPRCLQLHLAPELAATERAAVLDRWQQAEGQRSWVTSRDAAIAAGWFGEVHPEVTPRIGDIIVAARKGIAYYDSRVTNNAGRKMVGQHGSWSDEELRVPLLRFGAFAR